MDAKSETLRARIFNLCARSRDVPVLRLKIQKVFTSNHIVVACAETFEQDRTAEF